jgi:formate hydrogenlyase subunit 3/multisubunit Na+/H+ antiporter MnhD subunit
MSALLILAPLAPLLAGMAAFVAPARPAAILLALSAVPGLAAGLTAAGAQAPLPGLLFGATLGLTPALAPGMAAVALLWGAAALHAMGTGGPAAEDGPGGARFRVCMGLAAAGQMGVFVAQDMASFYVAFAALSFAGYGLVRHRPTPEARRAARVYLAFVVIGELALFAALALINVGQNGLGLPVATGVAPPAAAWWLLAVGFGAKAGLVPLHVWLPLAHPVAPVPASAALSGGTLKAGLVGLMLFLPEGAAPQGFGAALVAAGLVGAFGAAVWGVLQRDAKVVLAYSSVSQMGLALAVTGAASAGWTPPGAAAAAVGLFIAHHALAKGVLFLSVEPGAPRGAALALAGFCALSMIGAPLTPGYAVKQALSAAAPSLADALSLSAWGTAALMARALLLLRGKPGGGGPARGAALGAVAAALVATPFAVGVEIGGGLASLTSALPAVAVGALAVALSATGRPAPTLPAGDLAALFERLAAAALAFARAAGDAAARLRAAAASTALAAGAVAAALAVRLADPGADDEQARWRMAGLTMALAFAALSAAALGF